MVLGSKPIDLAGSLRPSGTGLTESGPRHSLTRFHIPGEGTVPATKSRTRPSGSDTGTPPSWPSERYPPPGPLFDVGGGNGVVSATIDARGWPVVLVEPGEAGIANGLARGLRNVVQARFEDAAFEAGVLPAVGLFDVIEHIPDDVAFLKEVGSKLAADGVVYATVPAYGWLWSIDDQEAGHFRRYSKRGAASVFQEAGFDIVYTTYLFAPLPPGMFLLRSLPFRLRLIRQVSPDRTEREHQTGGFAPRLLTALLRAERRRLPERRVPFGSSIVIVAVKSGPSADTKRALGGMWPNQSKATEQ